VTHPTAGATTVEGDVTSPKEACFSARTVEIHGDGGAARVSSPTNSLGHFDVNCGFEDSTVTADVFKTVYKKSRGHRHIRKADSDDYP
jgi:hypothetical protein